MRALESTFSKRDSALRDKAGSLWLASSIDTQVLSPCSPLHNPAFSSQILESQNGFTKQAQNLESTFQQSYHSPTAKQATAVQGEAAAGFFRIPRILEEEKSSLRADNGGEAIHKDTRQKVDSRFFTQTAQPAHHDSRNCGVASGAFCGFWGRARLEVCGYPKIHKIAAMDTQS